MNKTASLIHKHLRHLLLILAVAVGAHAFDNYVASLNLNLSERVENILHQEDKDATDTRTQVLQLCAVSASNSFKLMQNGACTDFSDKHFAELFSPTAAQGILHLATSHAHKLDTKQGFTPSISLARFTHVHQSNSDDEPLHA
ncbi:MAG: hypothetical protein ACK5LR_09635 [Mangrovibacterium sp.]